VIARAAWALAVTLAVLLGAGMGALMDTPDVPVPAPVVLHEDDPGWNCSTSGNGLCDRPGRAIKRG
jgi:hypothetical protein